MTVDPGQMVPQNPKTPVSEAASPRLGDRSVPPADLAVGGTGSTVDYVDAGGVEVGDLVLTGAAWREVLGFSPNGRVILGDAVNGQADGGLF